MNFTIFICGLSMAALGLLLTTGSGLGFVFVAYIIAGWALLKWVNLFPRRKSLTSFTAQDLTITKQD